MFAQGDADSPRIPLGFGGVTASIGDHIAHSYRDPEDRLNVVGTNMAEGLRRGHKCVLSTSE